mmetsp:Transcript_62685/g.104217  ORF Transcript_62685/g.104217 Transcript_62685/m.104217 type:complete len:223 (-) Transcript_62685:15-683(-)
MGTTLDKCHMLRGHAFESFGGGGHGLFAWPPEGGQARAFGAWGDARTAPQDLSLRLRTNSVTGAVAAGFRWGVGRAAGVGTPREVTWCPHTERAHSVGGSRPLCRWEAEGSSHGHLEGGRATEPQVAGPQVLKSELPWICLCEAVGHKLETVHYSGPTVQVCLVEAASVGGCHTRRAPGHTQKERSDLPRICRMHNRLGLCIWIWSEVSSDETPSRTCALWL